MGDIGDNGEIRPSIDVWVVPDTMDANASAAHCPLVYDDGQSRDAEALFVMPDGTLNKLSGKIPSDAREIERLMSLKRQ
jgi:hypothetical protein